MVCAQASVRLEHCIALTDELRNRARFVLGVGGEERVLTHAQSMKIRCGGLLGMQRVLALEQSRPPAVLAVIDAVGQCYGSLDDFPFNEIVQDIRAFSHRKKRTDKKDGVSD